MEEVLTRTALCACAAAVGGETIATAVESREVQAPCRTDFVEVPDLTSGSGGLANEW